MSRVFIFAAGIAMSAPNHAENIRRFFNDLSTENMHLLDDFYAEDVVFRDPAGDISGRSALRGYYCHIYEPVTKIHFEFPHIQVQKDDVFATWTMTFSSRKLKGGRSLTVDGISHLRFNTDGQVTYHRDYFDMGAMIYEHVPLVGCLIRYIKSRLNNHQPGEAP
jgi:hypothetical protein